MSSIDVIIPCYKYGHFLRECVESVLAETTHKVRVLIIDDASPDNTAAVATELAKEDARVTFVRHVTNKKHIATYNEGIEWVSSDYMLLLSADDYLLPGALGRAVSLLNSHPEVGFVFGRVILSAESHLKDPTVSLGGKGGERRESKIISGLDFINLIALRGTVNFVPTPTAVVRTSLQKQLGGYREELPHSGDLEMWLRFAARAAVGQIEEYQAVYRQHGANMQCAYYEKRKRRLPDLQQREAALRYFYDNYGTRLPDAKRVLLSLLRPLSHEAIGYASEAFNNEEMELSKQILDFAVNVYPPIKRSSHWLIFSLKRRMGIKAWRSLQPFANWIRREKSPVDPV
jgi:glycosyltransferase involved in cell wall biosynthesis